MCQERDPYQHVNTTWYVQQPQTTPEKKLRKQSRDLKGGGLNEDHPTCNVICRATFSINCDRSMISYCAEGMVSTATRVAARLTATWGRSQHFQHNSRKHYRPETQRTNSQKNPMITTNATSYHTPIAKLRPRAASPGCIAHQCVNDQAAPLHTHR